MPGELGSLGALPGAIHLLTHWQRPLLHTAVFPWVVAVIPPGARAGLHTAPGGGLEGGHDGATVHRWPSHCAGSSVLRRVIHADTCATHLVSYPSWRHKTGLTTVRVPPFTADMPHTSLSAHHTQLGMARSGCYSTGSFPWLELTTSQPPALPQWHPRGSHINSANFTVQWYTLCLQMRYRYLQFILHGQIMVSMEIGSGSATYHSAYRWILKVSYHVCINNKQLEYIVVSKGTEGPLHQLRMD